MLDSTKGFLVRILNLFLLLLSLSLVIYGQKTVGHSYLLIELIGLIGLLFLLWNYNRKFR